MTRYGSETTTYTDGDSTIDVIDSIKDYKTIATFKRTSTRVKVANKQEETSQYLLFSDTIEQKRKDGILVVRDTDPAVQPSFLVEYPKKDVDGCYFIIRTYTEIVG